MFFPPRVFVTFCDSRTFTMSHLPDGDVVPIGCNASSPIFMSTRHDAHLVSRFNTLRSTQISGPAATVTLSRTPGLHLYGNGQLQLTSCTATGHVLTLGDNPLAVVMIFSYRSFRGFL